MDNARIEQLREERAALITQAVSLTDLAESEKRDLSDDEASQFDRLVESAERKAGEISRLEKAAELKPSLEQRDVAPPVDPTVRHARANDPEAHEKTYRPDNTREVSFLRDLLAAKGGNAAAQERLQRNEREALDHLGWTEDRANEYRDMSNASTAGEDFVPPLYLSDLYVTPNISARPFADACPKLPLPAKGTDISIPHLASGVAVAARADAGTVQETDGVTASITHDVNEIAGQVDIGRIAVMRSDPALDRVIVDTLRRRHDAYLDTQLLSGTGTAPQHRGVRAVSGVNTTSYTATTPTQAGLLPKIYEAISEVDTNRLEERATAIVLHGRRASWIAAGLSSTFPLVQQGQLTQAVGTQNGGFVNGFAGLQVIVDNNIGTAYGTGTNEDEIYVVALQDMYLMEGPLMARVWDSVGSGTGVIRYQVFSHSAFLSKRYPASISVLSGTGLVAPTF